MGIAMNPVGNYSPHSITNTNRQSIVKQTAPNVKTKETGDKQNELMPEEKEFFTKLYPGNKSEIMDYHFYEKSGKLSGVKLGSLIDRRG